MPGRGSIRHRGDTWEYLIEVGMRPRQRCQSCGRPFWVERRPLETCPRCGGELHEQDERFRVSDGGYRTRKACQAAMAKALTAIEQHTFVLPDDATVREFILQEWLPAIRGTLRPTTYASYTSLCERHVIPRLGAVQLQKLSPSQLNGLYAQLLEEGRVRGGGGLSNSSVRRVHAVIHRFCHDAVRWGRLTVNPAAAADPPKASAEHDELTVWNAEQLAAFLASTESDRLFGLWRLLAMTGMRRGEALGLRWDDLDMEAGQLSIRRALVPVNSVAQISEPKTKRGRRTIALDPETLEALKAHAARQADEQALWEGSWSDLGYVFTREGRPPARTSGCEQDLSGTSTARRPAADPPARSAPHLRHPGPCGRREPTCRLGAPRTRHRGLHLGHLLARPAASRPRCRGAHRRPAAAGRLTLG
jgi:integrase